MSFSALHGDALQLPAPLETPFDALLLSSAPLDRDNLLGMDMKQGCY